MHAEIIAIGTELTTGAKLDTNSQWLSLQLAELGIPTLFHTTVADELGLNVDVLRIASQRADLVVITGGLGPTLDDLTREAMAQLAGVPLELHQPSLERIEAFFRGRGYEMPARNRAQAMFPAGAEPLANPIGTAPGIWMLLPREGREPCRLAALPGVPSEMTKMFFEQVRSRLGAGKIVIRRARINCFGLGESAIEEMLGDLTARGHDPDIGITAHDATITLRMTAQGTSAAECQGKLDDASRQIREKLGDYVFGTEDEELEDVIVRELNAREQTLVTMEGATGGLLAQKLAGVAGAEDCYPIGNVLPKVGASMKELFRLESESDYTLIVGDEVLSTDASGQRISTIQIGLLTPDFPKGRVNTTTWTGNPAITKARTAKVALNLLRLELLGKPDE